jgi:pyruvate dehydrogenase E1 component alpha subunit
MTGHSAHDAADYVPRELREEWAQRDPISSLEKRMVEKDWVTTGEVEHLYAEIKKELDAAVEWAEKSPYPDPSELMDNVYEES